MWEVIIDNKTRKEDDFHIMNEEEFKESFDLLNQENSRETNNL
jgi:hypothetical protein